MDRVMRIKEEYACYTDFVLIDRLLDWLEREDGELEILAGFWLCLAAVTYFAAHLVRAFMK